MRMALVAAAAGMSSLPVIAYVSSRTLARSPDIEQRIAVSRP
jgi:hypothetical protein